jgi:hypothetical protein
VWPPIPPTSALIAETVTLTISDFDYSDLMVLWDLFGKIFRKAIGEKNSKNAKKSCKNRNSNKPLITRDAYGN